MEELKGTQEYKIKHFAFCYDNSCLIYEEAKYGASYWLQELSLDQFKGISKDGEDLYDMGIGLENINMFSDIEAVQNAYFAIKAGETLQGALEEVKMENLFETPKDIKADTEIVIDDSIAEIETLLDIMTITLQDKRESN